MKNKLFTTILCLLLVALLAAGCGPKELPEPTDDTTAAKVPETTVPRETEPPAEPPTTAPTEPALPADWKEFTLTNPKLQIQASFFLPGFDGWEETYNSKKDMISPVVSSRYTATIGDNAARVTVVLTANGKNKVAEFLEEGEPVQVQGYPACVSEEDMRWEYQINLGEYNEKADILAEVTIGVSSGEKSQLKELDSVREAFLSTVTATLDYEGKEDRSGKTCDGTGTARFPASFEFEGKPVEIYSGYGNYNPWVEAYGVFGDPGNLKGYATLYMPIPQSYWDASEEKGFTAFEFAGHPAYYLSTVFYDYVSTEIEFEVNGIYYDMFVSVSLNKDIPAADPDALLEEIKKENSPHVQTSIAFAEAMIQSAEFVVPPAEWFSE